MKKYCLAVLLVLSIILIGCNPDTEGKTYYIFYDANEATYGFVPTDNNRYKSGETAKVLDKNNLSKDGFEFIFWNTKKQGDGEKYNPGEFITVKNMNIRLYAIWVKLP
jgi:hypothetical protein